MRLVRFSEISEQAYKDYVADWEASGEVIVPWVTSRHYGEFMTLMHFWEDQGSEEVRKKGLVPATLYFMLDSRGRIIGAIHFRHELSDKPRDKGGHIGYGIRPADRGKGYGKKMLALMLGELADRGYQEVMLSCDDDNLPSRSVIEANGGFFEGLDQVDGKPVRRYWIPLAMGEN